MASIDWQKATTQKAGAMKKHLGQEERVTVNHSNEDIDKSKSHLNIYIGADDYEPMLDKVKARIAEVDKEHPPERDLGDKRVTCILLETPVPQAITDMGKADEFLRKAHKLFEDFFGAENVGGTCGHFDEVHKYTDKDGEEKMSLVHGHTVVAAYVEWTEDVKKSVKQDNGKYKQVKTGETRDRIGINGKHFVTKPRMTALNKAIDDMCQQEYGIAYNTGKTPDKKTVELLKKKSAEAESYLVNLLDGVPPLALEKKEPKPSLDPKFDYSKRPKVTDSGLKGRRQAKKQKNWDEDREKALEERDAAYQKYCAEVDARNEQARQEWERTYLTPENIAKAKAMVDDKAADVEAREQALAEGEADLARRMSDFEGEIEQAVKARTREQAQQITDLQATVREQGGQIETLTAELDEVTAERDELHDELYPPTHKSQGFGR